MDYPRGIFRRAFGVAVVASLVGAVTVLFRDGLGAVEDREVQKIARLVPIAGETSKYFLRRFSLYNQKRNFLTVLMSAFARR
ncbi:hypothetical protein ACFSOZ_02060 [Mesorhizobium newzealandense]|uniref:Uncharacterized protein n=1 Tax=Mesorhizobium newzealandense TaxID=1300302 RepID=A0ABW4U5U6_9HYPH